MRYTVLPALLLTLAACGGGGTAEETPNSDNPGEEIFPEQPDRLAEGRFAPRNECIKLPGAKAFLLDLEKAVKARDADALLKLADPAVKLDFGGGGGLVTFRERLAAEEGLLWQELDQITALGCAHSANGAMTLPWYFAQELGVEDPTRAMLVTGADVPVHEAASADSPVVAKVSWDLVDLHEGYDPRADFAQVTAPGGEEGFVAKESLRSPLDYRLIASRVGESWRIVSFVAGD